MTSIRTQYRIKRVELIENCIMLLINMLTLNKQDLERIPLPYFKNLKKILENKKIE